jgi:hypothetical protein
MLSNIDADSSYSYRKIQYCSYNREHHWPKSTSPLEFPLIHYFAKVYDKQFLHT